MRRPNLVTLLWAGLPVAFLVLFYFYPLSRVLMVSLRPEGSWDWTAWVKLVGRGYYARTLWFTFWQAAVSTLLTLVLAFPGAYVMARFRFRGQKLLQALITVPFVLPTVVVAAAFTSLLGESGLVNACLMKALGLSAPPIHLEQTIWAILLAHVFYNTTVAVRLIGGFWARLSPSLDEAARMLGASPAAAFWRITLPLLRPAIFSAGLLVFIFCFSSFGVILILGGPRFATIEVEIYRQALHLFNLPMAAVLSLVQILFTLALMGVYTSLQRRTAQQLTPAALAQTQRRAVTWMEKMVVGAAVGLMLLILGGPLLALVLQSLLTGGGMSLMFYRALFENRTQSIFFIPPMSAVGNSIGFAGLTLVVATLMGLTAAIGLSGRKSHLAALLDPIFMLPLSTSAVTLGFGFILALDRPPLNLRTSLWIVPLAHSLVAFPFVVRSILPALRSIPSVLKEAAQLLGASPLSAFCTVDLPIVGRALVVGAVFAFTVSLGEFGATAFVARPQMATMPLAIYRFLGQPGSLNYGQAMAMSSLLMLATAAGCLFLERFRIGGRGEF
jgi:thiamine transport system permease protein